MKKKTKIGFIGVNGRMCQAVIHTLINDPMKSTDIEIVAGIERENSILIGKRFDTIPGLSNFGELNRLRMDKNICGVKEQVDVWVDFSIPKSTLFHLKSLKNREAGYVIGTTGFSKKEIGVIHSLSKKFPIVMSGNFSIGINLMLYVLEKLLMVSVTDPFDIEVQETHHRMKIDAPSGTARMLLNKIQEIKKLNDKYLVYDRHQRVMPRKKKEIGITSRRGGGVIGEHEVTLYGENEILTLQHTAINRSAFSYGVIEAITFVNQKFLNDENGLFGIKDVLRLD